MGHKMRYWFCNLFGLVFKVIEVSYKMLMFPVALVNIREGL